MSSEADITLESVKGELDDLRAALDEERNARMSLKDELDKMRTELSEERNRRKSMQYTIADQQTELGEAKSKIVGLEKDLEIQTGMIADKEKVKELETSSDSVCEDLQQEQKKPISLESHGKGPKISFFARVSPTIVGIAPWATVIFSNVETNEGGAYNKATGEFVAPKAGLYVFFSTILAGWGLIIETVLQVNGNNKMLIYSGGCKQASGSNMTVLALKVGDVVKMVKHGPWGVKPFTIHHGWSTFSGYLLRADEE